MGDDVRKYIDDKFDKVINTLKWGVGILVTLLIIMGGAIGGNKIRSEKNRVAIERYDVAFKEMVTKQQMSRLIEFSKIRKEIIKATLSEHSDEEIDALWTRLEELERMVIEDDYGFYLRGLENKSYKERAMSD